MGHNDPGIQERQSILRRGPPNFLLPYGIELFAEGLQLVRSSQMEVRL